MCGQKKQNQRKSAPSCWPSATLRASVLTGHGELGLRPQTCTVLFRPSLPVLDNPKGDGRSKTKDQISKPGKWRRSANHAFNFQFPAFFILIRREGAPPTAKPMHSFNNSCGRRALAAKGFPIPFRLAEKHRMRWSLRDAPV